MWFQTARGGREGNNAFLNYEADGVDDVDDVSECFPLTQLSNPKKTLFLSKVFNESPLSFMCRRRGWIIIIIPWHVTVVLFPEGTVIRLTAGRGPIELSYECKVLDEENLYLVFEQKG